jgi:hypothetical protein
MPTECGLLGDENEVLLAFGSHGYANNGAGLVWECTCCRDLPDAAQICIFFVLSCEMVLEGLRREK